MCVMGDGERKEVRNAELSKPVCPTLEDAGAVENANSRITGSHTSPPTSTVVRVVVDIVRKVVNGR